jgi:hypothetical protein
MMDETLPCKMKAVLGCSTVLSYKMHPMPVAARPAVVCY